MLLTPVLDRLVLRLRGPRFHEILLQSTNLLLLVADQVLLCSQLLALPFE